MKRKIATLASVVLLGISVQARADQGNAVLESKAEGQVVMNARTYRVTDGTVLENAEGASVSFADLPTKAEGADDDASAVWYEASDDETAPVLSRLKLVGAIPD